MNEIWRDIEGYEGFYAVSNLGNVKNIQRNLILKLETVRKGYKAIYLSKNGKRKHFFVHILVAKAFIPNPNGLSLVNHKDENPANNNVENLEWCNYQHNNTYNGVHIKRALKQGYKVFQYDNEGKLVNVYNSTGEAARAIGKSRGNIASCCENKSLRAYGFVWSYVELEKEEILKKFEKQQYSNRTNDSKSKVVFQFDKNMSYINTYPSAREAARRLNISPSLIIGVCDGSKKSTHGFIFKYEK